LITKEFYDAKSAALEQEREAVEMAVYGCSWPKGT
jgi:hypothetical protein